MTDVKRELAELSADQRRYPDSTSQNRARVAEAALKEIARLEEVYRREREAHAGNLKAWQRCEEELRGCRAFERSVNEALNSGDGAYRP